MCTGQRDVASVRLAGGGNSAATSMAWSAVGELAVGTGNYSACGGVSVVSAETGKAKWSLGSSCTNNIFLKWATFH